jgi:hypothetical protein
MSMILSDQPDEENSIEAIKARKGRRVDVVEEMKAVYDACKKAKVQIPEDVMRFFNWSDPDPLGVEVEIPHRAFNSERKGQGIEIDVSRIPKDVAVVRFYNSW